MSFEGKPEDQSSSQGSIPSHPPLTPTLAEHIENKPHHVAFDKLHEDIAEAKTVLQESKKAYFQKETSLEEKYAAEIYYTKLEEELLAFEQKLDTLDGKPLLEVIDTSYRARNLVKLILADISPEQGRVLFDHVLSDSLENVEPLPVDPSQIEHLAKQLFESSGAKPGETMSLSGNKENISVILALARILEERGIRYYVDIRNDYLKVQLINHAPESGWKRLAKEETTFFSADRSRNDIGVWSNLASGLHVNREKYGEYKKYQSSLNQGFYTGEFKSTHTRIPTKDDAELDDIPYNRYLEIFFEACDQPWEELAKAQEELVNVLSKADHVLVENDDGTHLEMNIKGMSFANSVLANNIPGSEIFTSPHRNSVNGTLVAKGKFKYLAYPVVENIRLVFRDGKVIEYSADTNQDTLKQLIEIDPGASFLGELGIGMNPHLRHIGKKFVNISLLEKIGGSVHIALGRSYEQKEYAGKAVNLDNGNRSAIHWDIPVLLLEPKGRIVVDGVTIQERGEWKKGVGVSNQSVDILNEGWDALLHEKQPQWYRQQYPQGYHT